jgi:hypothetical protein
MGKARISPPAQWMRCLVCVDGRARKGPRRKTTTGANGSRRTIASRKKKMRRCRNRRRTRVGTAGRAGALDCDVAGARSPCRTWACTLRSSATSAAPHAAERGGALPRPRAVPRVPVARGLMLGQARPPSLMRCDLVELCRCGHARAVPCLGRASPGSCLDLDRMCGSRVSQPACGSISCPALANGRRVTGQGMQPCGAAAVA